jgi:hypothetical protein
MPVWGAELLRDAPLDRRAEDQVTGWIEALADHLARIQR